MLDMNSIADRIAKAVKGKGMRKGDFLKRCNLSVNALSHFNL